MMEGRAESIYFTLALFLSLELPQLGTMASLHVPATLVPTHPGAMK